MSPLEYIFTFYGLIHMFPQNAIVLKACEKELPHIMKSVLSKRQEECVTCVFFDGLSQKRTAEKLGIAQPTVCRHVNKGVEILLERLRYVIKVAEIVSDHYEQEQRK